MNKRLMFWAALVVAALGVSLAGSAFADSSAWHIGYYNPSGNALSNQAAILFHASGGSHSMKKHGPAPCVT